jgi:hypothetical protein
MFQSDPLFLQRQLRELFLDVLAAGAHQLAATDEVALVVVTRLAPHQQDAIVAARKGVGNPHQGTFIDDHMSRQEASVLRTLAGRLRGHYYDVNEKHVSTLSLGTLAMGAGVRKLTYDLVDIAIFVFAAGAIALALIPVLLEYFGSDWKTVRTARSTAVERSAP